MMWRELKQTSEFNLLLIYTWMQFWFVTAVSKYLNYDISEEYAVDSMEKKLAECQQKCLNHVNRMEDIRHPKQLLDYPT